MPRRVYVDGIFDLFHKGHVLQFKYLKELDNLDNYLVVGIISDKDAKGYKRLPVYNMECRKILIESCKYVDEIIENPPLIMTKNFIENNKIDLVCHGFSNKNDIKKQEKFFEVPRAMNKFRLVPYNTGISTTTIIENIKKNY